jgi:hypothetical protein
MKIKKKLYYTLQNTFSNSLSSLSRREKEKFLFYETEGKSEVERQKVEGYKKKQKKSR